MSNNEATKQLLRGLCGTYARLLITFACGWLVSSGFISSDTAHNITAPVLSNSDQIIGAIVLLVVAAAWKLHAQLTTQKKIETALDLPQGTPRGELEKAVNELSK